MVKGWEQKLTQPKKMKPQFSVDFKNQVLQDALGQLGPALDFECSTDLKQTGGSTEKPCNQKDGTIHAIVISCGRLRLRLGKSSTGVAKKDPQNQNQKRVTKSPNLFKLTIMTFLSFVPGIYVKQIAGVSQVRNHLPVASREGQCHDWPRWPNRQGGTQKKTGLPNRKWTWFGLCLMIFIGYHWFMAFDGFWCSIATQLWHNPPCFEIVQNVRQSTGTAIHFDEVDRGARWENIWAYLARFKHQNSPNRNIKMVFGETVVTVKRPFEKWRPWPRCWRCESIAREQTMRLKGPLMGVYRRGFFPNA